MSTLLLRLAGPLQAWGIDSKFDIRQTGREPSKSGVIGLLACALGIRRSDQEALAELNKLSFGVRVEQEGQLLRDYQTAKAYNKSKTPRLDYCKNEKPDSAYIPIRYYLADAVFLAAVSTEDEALLRRLEEALLHPAFPLYLGRRSCVPVLPLVLGMRTSPLEKALQDEPWQAADWYQKRWARQHRGQQPSLRLIIDSNLPEAVPVRDMPVSFDPNYRKYAFRKAIEKSIFVQPPGFVHDAMKEVETCT